MVRCSVGAPALLLAAVDAASSRNLRRETRNLQGSQWGDTSGKWGRPTPSPAAGLARGWDDDGWDGDHSESGSASASSKGGKSGATSGKTGKSGATSKTGKSSESGSASSGSSIDIDGWDDDGWGKPKERLCHPGKNSWVSAYLAIGAQRNAPSLSSSRIITIRVSNLVHI